MPFTPLKDDNAENPPQRGFTPLEEAVPAKGFTPIEQAPAEQPTINNANIDNPVSIIDTPQLAMPSQDPNLTLGALPPVSQETTPSPADSPLWFQSLLGKASVPNFAAPQNEPTQITTRVPDQVVKDMLAGNGDVKPEELNGVIQYLEQGSFENPQQVKELVSPLLSPEGQQAVDQAILVRDILNERKNTPQPDILPGGDGTQTFMEGLVKGLTFNELGDNKKITTGNPSVDKLLSAEHRATEKQDEARRKDNPIQAFAGEALGSVAPFTTGMKILRGLRVARGLAPVEESLSGYIAEGSKLGGPQAFATKPEGADNMSTEEELTSRALQGGVGVAAGAVLDFTSLKLGEFANRTFKALADKRFAAALKKEAKDKGFDNEDEYLNSLVEFVDTPDGVFVQPRQEVTSNLPGNKQSGGPEANRVTTDGTPGTETGPALPPPEGSGGKTEVPTKNELPPFKTEQDLRLQAHNEKAATQGLTPEQAKAFEPEPLTDHLTGFQGRRDRETTLKRAIDYVKETNQPGQYVAMDIVNLGGLNNRFGEPGADKIFKDFARIIEEELGQVGGHVNLFRHGGDEVSATVLGVDENALVQALNRVKQRASEYAKQNNLEDVIHPKGKKPGTGLNYGIASLSKKRSMDDVLEIAHDRLERNKEKDYVDVNVAEKTGQGRLDQQAPGEELVYNGHNGEGGDLRGRYHQRETGESRKPGENSAQEYERLASVTSDPEVKATLLKQAELARKASEQLPTENNQFTIQTDKGEIPYSHSRPVKEDSAEIFQPEGNSKPDLTEEFGQQVKHVETGTFPTGLRTIKNASDVAHVIAPIRKDAQESFLAVVTDNNGKILRIAKLHKGDQLQATIDPALVAGAISNTPNGARAWIAHNHPTGNVKQSEADKALTAKLDDLLQGSGIKLEGSVVIGPGGRAHSHINASGKKENIEATTPAPRKETQPITERKLMGKSNPHGPVTDTESAHKALKEIAGDREGVLLLDTDNKPKGFVELSGNDLRELRKGESGGSRKLFKAMDTTNADAFIVRTDSKAAAGNMSAFAEQTGKRLVDVVSTEGKSLRDTPEGIPTQSTFYANPFIPVIGETLRDIGLHPGRNLGGAFVGGTIGATNSKEEVGSPLWWSDVVLGAVVSTGVFQAARATRLLGKGSIIDNSIAHLGRFIDSLPLIGRGPSELRELKRKQRLMHQLLDRQTETIGSELLRRFTPSERAMMSDLIETHGIVKDLNIIHRQAEALDKHITFAAEQMKKLKMLPEDLETGGYLHRYYAKHLGLDKMFKQAKKQSLSGSYTIARGTNDTFETNFLSANTRKLVDQIDTLRKKIDKAKDGDNLSELKKQLKDLQQNELVEYTGLQNGALKSFIFAKDEVARVSGPGHKAVLAHRDTQGITGENETPVLAGVEHLTQTDRTWFARGKTGKQALLHRDWTKAERRSWGEIDDAGYRYVRGMAEVSHDLSLATLFDTVSRNSEWVSDVPRQSGRKNIDWIEVPKSKVGKGSPLQKYGSLAGKYVRPDVWHGLQGYGRSIFGESRASKIYRGALSKWKLYKTVYNPVTHLNNTYSNIEMLHMAGYSLGTIRRGLKHMRQGEDSALWREARDNGLFGTDWSTSILSSSEGANNEALNSISEQLRTQSEIPDAELATSTLMDLKHWWINSANAVRGADTPLKTGAEIAKAMRAPVMKGVKFSLKPVNAAAKTAQRLYKFEDEVFKMAVFQAERAKGASPEDAVITAQNLFFDYGDVPEVVKIVRDFPIGSPFISYTYFAIPAIAKNIAQHPEMVLSLVAGYEAWNYGALVSQGMDPGEYWATERAEEEVSPPWERGRSLWGAKNTVHIPFIESYRLAVGRAHALGNPFMSDAGGRKKLPEVPYASNFWGSSIFGGNPLHALLDVLVNEDWKGKEIYKPGAPKEERAKKIAAYLYQAWTPSNPLIPGGYHQTKILEGMANDARNNKNSLVKPVVDAANGIAETLGLEGFTGKDRMDNEILTRDAVLGSVGVKLRPIRFEQSEDFQSSQYHTQKKLLNDWLKKKIQLNSENRITDAQLNEYEKAYDAGIDAIENKEDKTFSAAEYLKGR